MRKLLSVLFSIVLIFMLVACSEKNQGENKEVVETQTQNVEIKEKTPKDTLSKFVLENGSYDEETDHYVYIKNASSVEDTTAYFGISYNQTNDEVLFSFYKAYDDQENSLIDTLAVLLEFEKTQNSPAMEVSLLGSFEAYQIYAFGEIYPEQVSMENLEIHNIRYYLNDDIPLTDPELTSHINSLFDLELKKLILYLYATLEEIPDITIQELGFTNLVSVTE